MEYRIEKDTMGEVSVPIDQYWGAQTERSRNNFKIGPSGSMPKEIIHAFAHLKKAAAQAKCEARDRYLAAMEGIKPNFYMVVDAERWNTPAAAVPGSTQDLQRQRLAAQMPRLNTADGNWEIYSIASNNTVYRFTANTEEQAVQAFGIWQDAVREPSLSREGFNLRTTPGAAPQVQQQQQAQSRESLPAGNARWRIYDTNGNEVYSFVNTTSQSDANQYARNWMINTAPAEVRSRGPFNIVPDPI